MSLVWDYRTGDVINPETGEVVDRIYCDEQMTYHDHYETAVRRHHEVLLPTVSMRKSMKKRFSRVKSLLMSILGRPLTSKERVRLARWLVTARRLTMNKREMMWLYATVYMFLSDINVDPNPHVPTRAALVASSITRPNRQVIILKKINESLGRLGRPHLAPVASEILRVLMERYSQEVSGRSSSMIAGIAVYAASAMTEDSPLTKDAVARVVGVSNLRQKYAYKVVSSPFRIVADMEICDAVSRRARLHSRVVCVDRDGRASHSHVNGVSTG